MSANQTTDRRKLLLPLYNDVAANSVDCDPMFFSKAVNILNAAEAKSAARVIEEWQSERMVTRNRKRDADDTVEKVAQLRSRRRQRI